MSNIRLFDYQIENIFDAIKKNNRVVFADKSGLGKRAQVIGLLNENKNDKIIIITSNCIKMCWKEQIINFSNYINENEINITKKTSDELNLKCNIVSFDYVMKNEDKIKNFLIGDSSLIVDQNKRLKKHKNKITETVSYLSSFSKDVSVLLQLFDYREIKDWYSIMSFIRPQQDWRHLLTLQNKEDVYKFKSFLEKNILVKSKK